MRVLICPYTDFGHLYPALDIGRELIRRAHTVAVLCLPAGEAATRAAGLDALPVTDFTDSTGAGFSIAHWFTHGAAQFHAVRQAAREFGADAMVGSLLGLGALLAAEREDIPAVLVGYAAHITTYRRDSPPEPDEPAQRRGREIQLTRLYRQLRTEVGLPPQPTADAARAMRGAGVLLRGHPDLEYPGSVLPDGVHHIGPCSWEPPARPETLHAIDQRLHRTGKRVVYVHLGRVFGGASLWPLINRLFTGGEFQAVVELGRSGDAHPSAGADVYPVRMPWMSPLLRRAELVLTSGTTAPVLAALAAGLPLLAAPAGAEQPLLAEACVRTGAARRIAQTPDQVSPTVLAEMTGDHAFARNSHLIASRLAAMNGPANAADLIEAAAYTSPRSSLRPLTATVNTVTTFT